MRKTDFAIALGLVMCSFLSISVSSQATKQAEADEAYEVYSLILKSKYSGDKLKQLVIDRMTLKDSEGSSQELNDKFSLKVKVMLIDPTTLSAIFSQNVKDPWEAFYKEFPDSGGFIKLSKVKFDADGRKAYIFVEHHCGWLCASGKSYTVVREGKGWKIESEQLIWIS